MMNGVLWEDKFAVALSSAGAGPVGQVKQVGPTSTVGPMIHRWALWASLRLERASHSALSGVAGASRRNGPASAAIPVNTSYDRL